MTAVAPTPDLAAPRSGRRAASGATMLAAGESHGNGPACGIVIAPAH